jgi:hypothetical protein
VAVSAPSSVRALVTKERLPTLLAILVVVGACVLRLSLIRTARFCGDEAEFWAMARSIATGEAHPKLGPPVSGGAARHPGPAFYYIMALPELISKTPESANAFIALLGGASVGLYWDGLRRFFGPWGALLAASLLACAPWSTLYADRIWNANLLCILVVIAFWFACRLRERPDSELVVPFIALCILLPQVHMPAPAALTAIIVLAWPALRHARWYRLVLGVALGIALYEPFIANELTTGFSDTKAILHETGAVRTMGWALVPVYVFRMLTTDTSYQLLAGYWGGLDEPAAIKEQFFGNSDFPFSPVRVTFFLVSIVFLGVAVAWGVSSFVRARKAKEPLPWAGTFLGAGVTGFAANVLLMALTGKAIFGHYVASLLPFYFVMFAALGQKLEEASARTREIVLGLAGVTAVGGIVATLHVSRMMDIRNSLLAQRTVLEQIYKDLSPGERSVSLSASFRLDMTGYDHLSSIIYERPLSFGGRSRLAYRLRLAPLGLGATVGTMSGSEVLEFGPVIMYRVPR